MIGSYSALTIFYSSECSSSYYGFNCEDQCNKCNNTLCERFEGNCTYGCIKGYTGHQCLISGLYNTPFNIIIIYNLFTVSIHH